MNDRQNYHLKKNQNYHHKNVQDVESYCKFKMKINWVTSKKVNYQNITIKSEKKKIRSNSLQNQAG